MYTSGSTGRPKGVMVDASGVDQLSVLVRRGLRHGERLRSARAVLAVLRSDDHRSLRAAALRKAREAPSGRFRDRGAISRARGTLGLLGHQDHSGAPRSACSGDGAAGRGGTDWRLRHRRRAPEVREPCTLARVRAGDRDLQRVRPHRDGGRVLDLSRAPGGSAVGSRSHRAPDREHATLRARPPPRARADRRDGGAVRRRGRRRRAATGSGPS